MNNYYYYYFIFGGKLFYLGRILMDRKVRFLFKDEKLLITNYLNRKNIILRNFVGT